jgi:hypothetical protein
MSAEREEGFHEGIAFAIECISRQMVKFPNDPFLVLDAVRKSINARPTEKGRPEAWHTSDSSNAIYDVPNIF